MNDTLSTVKFEDLENDHSENSSENSYSSETDLSIKLADLEKKVLKLIAFVMEDISELKESAKKHRKKYDKENNNFDSWKFTIYVGNINNSTSSKTLIAYFSRFGKVNHVYFIRHNTAFVEFQNISSVEKCLNDGPHYLNGRTLKVDKRLKSHCSINAKDQLNYKARNTDYKTLRYRPY